MIKKILSIFILFVCLSPVLIKAQTGIASTNGAPDLINIRSDANMNSRVIAQIYYGTKVNILDTIITDRYTFYKINYDGKNIGYVVNTLIDLEPEYPSDDTYCSYLKSIGFDESYCPYLIKLHQEHPNWTFTANRVDANFDDIISGEEYQNYIQIDSTFDKKYFLDKYITSTTPKEGNNWYESTNAINAYFLDPRNFLKEKTIFMYEDLGCDDNSYWRLNQDKAKSTITSIFGSGSYLTNEYDTTTPGATYGYNDLFMEAGLTYKISPIHLATRVRQEGGSNSNYVSITGNYSSIYVDKNRVSQNLKGYYNYYNIGAYGGTSPVLEGLVYACGPNCGKSATYQRPWNTRRKAILGGAEQIASSYISIGQSNLYLQKFDVIYREGRIRFSHQYQTNVTAPISEGYSAYSSYIKNNIVSNGSNITKEAEIPINFSIPVFNNMGSIRNMPSILDGDNYLSGIYINGNIIDNFDADIIEYNKYVIDTTTSVNVGITKNNNASVTGDGDVTLDNEITSIIINVVAENGNLRTYKVNVIKVNDTKTINEIMNNVGVKISNNIIGDIKGNTAISTLVSSINSVSPSASVKVYSSDNLLVTSRELRTGDRVVITNLLNETITYEIAVIGDPSGDGNITILDLLKVQKHIAGTSLLTGCSLMGADTNNDNTVDIVDLLRIQKHILGSITLN